MGIVVLAEHEGLHAAGVVQHGQGVQPVIPQHVVRFGQRDAVAGEDQLFQRGHEFLDLGVHGHAGHAVVAAGDQADDLAFARAVFRDRCRGVTRAFLQAEQVRQRRFGRDVRVAGYETGFRRLDAGDHGRFVLHALRTVDEGDAALLRQRHRQLIAGNGLHDGGHHGDIHGDGGLFALPELGDGRLQADVRGNAALV